MNYTTDRTRGQLPGAPADAAPRSIWTVAQFSARFPAWTPASLRALVLNANDRKNSRGEVIRGNGLAESGAVLRVGRRVLIDEQAFFQWIAAQQTGRTAIESTGVPQSERLAAEKTAEAQVLKSPGSRKRRANAGGRQTP